MRGSAAVRISGRFPEGPLRRRNAPHMNPNDKLRDARATRRTDDPRANPAGALAIRRADGLCDVRAIGRAVDPPRRRPVRSYLRFSSRSFCNSYIRSRNFAAARKSSDFAARSICSLARAISSSRFSPAV